MGVLKRTMESAPTRPRDNASDDLTTEMTSTVVNSMNGNTWENSSRFERVEPYRRKCQLRKSARIMPTPRFRSTVSSDEQLSNLVFRQLNQAAA